MRHAALSCLVAAVVLVAPALTEAATFSGILRCSIAGGLGLVVQSQRAVNCVYYRPNGNAEFYLGSTSRFGLDFGGANARTAVFDVYDAAALPPGALQGGFTGAGIGVTLGRGIAADALVGGASGAIRLLPAANSHFTGVDINAGLGTLRLTYEGSERFRGR